MFHEKASFFRGPCVSVRAVAAAEAKAVAAEAAAALAELRDPQQSRARAPEPFFASTNRPALPQLS